MDYIPLRMGAVGPAVEQVQKALLGLGYPVEKADGVFGLGTRNAVIAFQGDNELPVDGIVAKNTWDALEQRSGYTWIVGQDAPGPDASEQVVPGPDASEPVVAGTDKAERTVPKPDATERAVPKPDAAERAVPKPDAAKPAVSEPAALEPWKLAEMEEPPAPRAAAEEPAAPQTRPDVIGGPPVKTVPLIDWDMAEGEEVPAAPQVVPPPADEQEIRAVPEPETIAAPEPEIIVEQEPETIIAQEPEIIAAQEPEIIVEPEPEIITAPVSASPPAAGLKLGSRNSRVMALQRRLKELGYYTGATTGYFGELTYRSLMRFQQESGLPATGVADELTLEKLREDREPGVLSKGDRGESVTQLQQELQALGFYPSEICGIFGDETLEGVISFQKSVGLPPTGRVNGRTRDELAEALRRQGDVVLT